MANDEQEKQNRAMVKKRAEELGESNSAQIFAIQHEPSTLGSTVDGHFSVGNWYSRYGEVYES